MTLPEVAAKKAAAKTTATKTVSKNNGRKTVVKRTSVAEGGNRSTVVERTTGKTVGAKAASAKHSWMPRISPAKSTVRYRQILVAELLISLVVVLAGLNKGAKQKDFSDKTKQAAAILTVFLILSLMTSAGPSAARVSAALGGVILLSLLLTTVTSDYITNFNPDWILPGQQPGESPQQSGDLPSDGQIPFNPGGINRLPGTIINPPLIPPTAQ